MKRFGLVILTSLILKQHVGYFGTDLVILNQNQMTATEFFSKLPHHTSGRTFHPLRRAQQARMYGRYLVESRIEPGALRLRSPDLATRPPHPPHIQTEKGLQNA
ncbi:hypothetical protein AVEN_93517-1 [Araneus ventricosus]|uniref:Uncharacterized protein n=1 Tax=Araneus ventricosus TaxID=182803 RepID=A0A4Y2AR70_ARAVE|nr:hypothetical protein AVEN_93517-1 [Araneus ventricosus]